MELRNLLEIIYRRKWIILQAFLVISLTTIVGSFLITPIYESSAKVLIRTSDSSSSLLSNIGLSDLTSLFSSDSEMDTYIELATLSPVFEEVISKLQLRTGDGSLMAPGGLYASGFITSTLFPQPNVKISEIEETDLIKIIATSPDGKEAAMIANTLASIFIEQDQKRNREEYSVGKKFIEDYIKLAKAEYQDVVQEIKQYMIAEKTIDITEETKKAIEKMAELMKEKEDNIIDISEVRARIETLKAQLDNGSEMVVSSSAINENPQIEALIRTLSGLELELTGELIDKKQAHPLIISLKQRIKKTREDLRKEMGLYQRSSATLEHLQRELSALEAHLVGVNADIDKYSSMAQSIPDKVFTKSQLELKLKVTQGLYSSLLEYVYQVGIAEEMTLSDIRLVEHATEPDYPKSPNKALNGIVGVFLGLMFGLGLAFLKDYLDDTIKTQEDLKEFGVALLGSITLFKKKEKFIISERDPKDNISESYRTVRNSIRFATLDKPLKSLLVSSSQPGEGKTTTVVNLGISFTREGKKVLLIDTDLRKARIHEVFGISNSIGLTTLLAGEAKLEDAIKSSDTKIEGLDLLTSGPVPPDPGQLLESEKMIQLIKDLSQKYDIIILDSPPILVSHDAIVLAGYTDGSVIVLESKTVTRRTFSLTQKHLVDAHIQPLGVIVNKYETKRAGDYYYYSSDYYNSK